MTDLRVTYDAQANAAYIYLMDPGTPSKIARTYPCDPIKVDGMINLDFDASGRLMGIEVLGADRKIPRDLLEAAERLDI